VHDVTVTVTVTEFHSSTRLFSEESCSVMGLSEKGFSASVGTAGDCCAPCGERRSGGSAFQTTGATVEKLRWPMDVNTE